MNYNQATDYLKQIYTRGSHPGLSRVFELLNNLDNPQKQLKIIHVAGTNGKGSVCVMLEQILCEAGLKTGLFTSPSMSKINECYRICGKPVSDKDFARLVNHVKSSEASMSGKPTGFEFETAAALELFRKSNCDIVILETGMGGMLDATNVCDTPLLSVITDIGLDHEDFLGSTIKDIAIQKSGIIKADRPVIFGGTNKDALEIIEAKAKELCSPLTVVDYDRIANVKYSLSGTELEFDLFGNQSVKFSLPLLGLYQPKNCAIVLTALEVLKNHGFIVSTAAAANGIQRTKWRGRFEIVRRKPLIIYDGAHNPHGMSMCTKSLKQYFGDSKVNIIMGVMADKNYNDMLDMLCPYVDTAFTVTPNNPRALSAAELAECFLSKGINAFWFDSINDGVKNAVQHCEHNKLPLIILGTLYMYQDAVNAISAAYTL